MENRLPPSRTAGLGHDRTDDIHELGETGRLHTIRIVDHRDQRTADDQRVFEVVDFFDELRRLRPTGLAQVRGRMRLVPNVPFIQRQHDALWRTPLRRHGIADRGDFFDEKIQIVDDGEVFLMSSLSLRKYWWSEMKSTSLKQ